MDKETKIAEFKENENTKKINGGINLTQPISHLEYVHGHIPNQHSHVQ